MYDGLPRTKSQIDSTAGATTGLLREPDVAPLPQEYDNEGEDRDNPKKKKKEENILAKKSKNDPNANKGLHSINKNQVIS